MGHGLGHHVQLINDLMDKICERLWTPPDLNLMHSNILKKYPRYPTPHQVIINEIDVPIVTSAD